MGLRLIGGHVRVPIRVKGVGAKPWCGFDVVMGNGVMVRVPARFDEGASRRLFGRGDVMLALPAIGKGVREPEAWEHASVL